MSSVATEQFMDTHLGNEAIHFTYFIGVEDIIFFTEKAKTYR